jgi:hypothetical protein
MSDEMPKKFTDPKTSKKVEEEEESHENSGLPDAKNRQKEDAATIEKKLGAG